MADREIETDAGVAEHGGTLGIVWPYTATTATCNKLAQKIIYNNLQFDSKIFTRLFDSKDK